MPENINKMQVFLLNILQITVLSELSSLNCRSYYIFSKPGTILIRGIK